MVYSTVTLSAEEQQVLDTIKVCFDLKNGNSNKKPIITAKFIAKHLDGYSSSQLHEIIDSLYKKGLIVCTCDTSKNHKKQITGIA